MSKKEKTSLSNNKKLIDVVAEDRDWISVIENELRFQENWQKDWGFLSKGEDISAKPKTKRDKINELEEKLKSMDNIKIKSEYKNNFIGNSYDIKVNSFNKRKESELLPQSRRPKALSIAHKHLLETRGDNYENEPYDNLMK